MRRILDANTGLNQFQDGNPQTGLDATQCDSDFFNIFQEELCNAITGAGLTVDQSHEFTGDPSGTNNDTSQLLKAIRALVMGGSASKVSLANNQSSPANVTGLSFSGATYDTVRIFYSVYLSSSSTELKRSGELVLQYKPTAATWDITDTGENFGTDDLTGLAFSVTSAGQVQYTSPNIGGTGFVGYLRYSLKTLGQ